MRGSVFLALALFLFVGFWNSSAAQGQDPAADEGQPAETQRKESTITAADDDIWGKVRDLATVIQQDPVDQTRLESLRNRIAEIQRELNIVELEYPPLYLVNEARLRTREQAYDSADVLLKEAKLLNPDLPVVEFAQAELALSQGSYFAYASHYMRGLSMQRKSFWGRYFFQGNLNILVVKILAGFFVLFVSFLVMREFNVIAFDLSRFLPSSFNHLGLRVLGVTLLLLPLLFGVGLLLTALVWMVLVWSYTTKIERGVMLGAMVLLMATPWLLETSAKNFAIYDEFDLQVHNYVLRGGYSEEVVAALEEVLERQPANHMAAFYLGVLYKRKGGLENLLKAEQYFTRASSRTSYVPAIINLGNVYFHTGRKDLALEKYQQAINRDSDRAMAHYNLSRYYNDALQFNPGTEAFNRANTLDPEAVKRAEERFQENHWNRGTVDEIPSRDELVEELQATMQGYRFSNPGGWNSVLWGLPSGSLQMTLVIFALIALALDFIRPKVYPAAMRCAMSHTPFLPTEENKGPYCEQTLNLFFKGDHVDAEARDEWKRQFQRKELYLRIVSYVMTLIAPGSGHILNEKSILGSIFLAIWVVALGACVLSGFWMSHPLVMFTIGDVFRGMALVLTAMVLYVASILTMIGEV